MFGRDKTLNYIVLEKAKFRIPMFAKVKAPNSSVRIIKNTEIAMFGKAKI